MTLKTKLYKTKDCFTFMDTDNDQAVILDYPVLFHLFANKNNDWCQNNRPKIACLHSSVI